MYSALKLSEYPVISTPVRISNQGTSQSVPDMAFDFSGSSSSRVGKVRISVFPVLVVAYLCKTSLHTEAVVASTDVNFLSF